MRTKWLPFSIAAFIFLAACFNSAAIGAVYLHLPVACDRDFPQFYLLSLALAQRLSIYQPLPVLQSLFLPECLALPFKHAAPFPPTSVLLMFPLSTLTFIEASRIFFLFSLACQFVSGFLLYRALELRNKTILLVLCAVPLAWAPGEYDLAVGNLNSMLLLCMSGAFLAIKRGRSGIAGVLVGLAFALKLEGWLIVAGFLVARRYRFCLGFLFSMTGVFLAALVIAGPHEFFEWRSVLSSSDMDLYWHSSRNLSLSTLGNRLFAGMDPLHQGFAIPAILEAPALAGKASLIACVLVGLSAIAASLTKADDSAKFLGLLTISQTVTAISWEHHYLLLWPSLVVAVLAYSSGRGAGFVAALTLLALFFCWDGYIDLLRGSGNAAKALGPLLPAVFALVMGFSLLVGKERNNNKASNPARRKSSNPACTP